MNKFISVLLWILFVLTVLFIPLAFAGFGASASEGHLTGIEFYGIILYLVGIAVILGFLAFNTSKLKHATLLLSSILCIMLFTGPFIYSNVVHDSFSNWNSSYQYRGSPNKNYTEEERVIRAEQGLKLYRTNVINGILKGLIPFYLSLILLFYFYNKRKEFIY